MNISKLICLPSDGWRKTAVINTVIVGIFATANLSTLIWSLTKNGLYENNTFRADECSKISLLNTFLHLLLNIASSLIIASSNFFMQVLNSPTRAEVDQAHARKRWLEIGVPSFRNASISQPNSLWFISKYYKMALPTSVGNCDNTCGGPLGIDDSMRDPINDKQVTNPEWVHPWWIADSNTTWGPPWGTNNSDMWQFDAIYDNGSWSYMCEGLPRPPYLNNSSNSVRVQYCLAEPFEPGCELGISNLLLLMVTICVFTKLLLCAIVVSALSDDPLVTPGDAVASFIRIPDPTTVGRCATTIPDIRSDLSDRKPVQWPERSKRFVHTASAATWARNYAFFCLLLIFLGFVMKAALSSYPISAS